MEKYVLIEMGPRNFVLAENIVGTKNTYRGIATFRSKYQAEAILKLITQGVK